MTEKIAICLATYGYSPYLAEQIESLRSQSNQNFVVYWGDDYSSTDERNRMRILFQGLELKEFRFNRIGSSANFLRLLSQTTEKFVAFCDQDDIWLPQKLEAQMNSLALFEHTPALCHSEILILKQGKLNRNISNCSEHSLAKLVSENCAKGCSIMLNGSARDKLIKSRNSNVMWHDWWSISVIAAIGKVVKIEEPLTIYRLHNSNQIGIPNITTKFFRWLNRKPASVINQFQQILDIYSFEMKVDSRNEIIEFIRRFDVDGSLRVVSSIIDRRRRHNPIEDVLRRFSWGLRKP